MKKSFGQKLLEIIAVIVLSVQCATASSQTGYIRKMNSELDLAVCPFCGHGPKETSLDLIKKKTCKKYKITMTEIESSSRKKYTVKARNEAIILCRRQTGATLEEIGRCFNRSHSAVIHAIKSFQL